VTGARHTVAVPELIVIVGPIASGKSTVAHGLGRRFQAADRPERTAGDPGRGLSKDPDFLRAAYARAGSLRPGLPPADWTFDTTALAAGEIVDALTAELLPG
jgi:hypothetical protein